VGRNGAVLVGTVIAALTALSLVPAAAQSSTKATATEVGVTAGEIHIAVVADVDNPLAPGFFEGRVVDGVQAGART